MSARQTLCGATVLVRCDMSKGVTEACADHIRDLTDRGARVAVIAGLDDPRGDINLAMSLRPLSQALARKTGMPVHFVSDCVGPVAEAGLASAPEGSVALLENIRFHRDSVRQSRTFAMRLSVLADYFSVLGGLPDNASPWIRELSALLPDPASPLAKTA
jgi:3-phosphoglycerate kinase